MDTQASTTSESSANVIGKVEMTGTGTFIPKAREGT